MSGKPENRRAEAIARINAIDRDRLAEGPDRKAFFDAVYQQAEGEAAAVPWADLAPKPELVHWLAGHPGNGATALDVACGLGDNAEAIAAAGYAVTAFDGAAEAIEWARRRFPDSPVNYRVADLLSPPSDWKSGFDLVYECYTVQSVPPELHSEFIAAIVGLVAPGGTLLVYTRVRPDVEQASGPPWPLTQAELSLYSTAGLEVVSDRRFTTERHGRTVPHAFVELRRPSGAAAA